VGTMDEDAVKDAAEEEPTKGESISHQKDM
jgi:hypothetical protein